MAVSWLGKIGGKDADSLEVSSGFDAEKNCNCSDWNELKEQKNIFKKLVTILFRLLLSFWVDYFYGSIHYRHILIFNFQEENSFVHMAAF